jgi:leucyl aminopeptidase
MDIEVVARAPHRVPADVVVQLFRLPWQRGQLAVRDQIRRDAGRLVMRHAGALTWMETRGASAPRALLACVGPGPDGSPGLTHLTHLTWAGGPGSMEQDDARRRATRQLGASIERACDHQGLERIVIAPVPLGLELDLLVQGMLVRAHGTTEFAPQWLPSSITHLTICVEREALQHARQLVRRVQIIADATSFARQLGDLPANVGHPRELARRIRVRAREVGLKARVLGPKQLQALGMGLLMGVAGGGAPPAVVVLEHVPPGRGPHPTLALLGKGVTLDTGGYNLKTTPHMHRFTDDKAGAVAVVGAMLALAQLGVPARVIGVAPILENVVSRAAYKPGDILTAMDGTTVYIENTDAEGRLVLADCLTWLQRERPDAVIDIATLTGAADNALGDPFAALYGNDAPLIEAIQAAGLHTGELVWPLPVHPHHDDNLVHSRAMIRNASDAPGGAAAATAFLRRFVKFPWAHIDMAGRGSHVHEQIEMAAGATGWGTSLLVAAAERWAAAQESTP